MAADENHEVYAPDQLKPGNRKRGQKGAIISALIMLMFFWGNQQGKTEMIWLVGVAVALIAIVIGDMILRRNGLRAND